MWRNDTLQSRILVLVVVLVQGFYWYYCNVTGICTNNITGSGLCSYTGTLTGTCSDTCPGISTITCTGTDTDCTCTGTVSDCTCTSTGDCTCTSTGTCTALVQILVLVWLLVLVLILVIILVIVLVLLLDNVKCARNTETCPQDFYKIRGSDLISASEANFKMLNTEGYNDTRIQ